MTAIEQGTQGRGEGVASSRATWHVSSETAGVFRGVERCMNRWDYRVSVHTKEESPEGRVTLIVEGDDIEQFTALARTAGSLNMLFKDLVPDADMRAQIVMKSVNDVIDAQFGARRVAQKESVHKSITAHYAQPHRD